ncbi:aromatic compound dioxygenase [Gonapodya prolifera JEL478]|uniref:Aromatic compound dioxygenase n=1 Tax=Gonapodya prolifera (strain JEL478) TaxID=1344416 RepID=A0A139AYI5_GONPJ|nr:aromatic compound dioxygenase [Gonapodya prolifera JEL478]|eukprot:KXS21812.1 aromatic compound dioxygenase [Gonapodya prolifera JEL478]
MKIISLLLLAVAVGTALVEVQSHPGTHDTQLSGHSKRALAKCSNSLKTGTLGRRSLARRAELFGRLSLTKSSLKKRDLASVVSTSHKSSLAGVSPSTPSETLFNSSGACVLEPDVTQGPYFVAGEYFRTDVRDGEKGVDLYVDMQFVDVSTCEPVSNIWVDFWHANATGVYSGVVANGNGDFSDSTNVNTTHGRGIAQTGSEGVVQFLTNFPGHYTGRATHIHVLTHTSDSVLINGTYVSATANATHVGQIFFDQDLITAMDVIAPYSSNTQAVTLNTVDSIMSQSAEGFDPVVNYALLGESLDDGLLAWITIGINVSASSSVPPSYLYDSVSGGVANAAYADGAGMPGGNAGGPNGTGPGGPGGNGTMPSGPPPNGTMTGGVPVGTGVPQSLAPSPATVTTSTTKAPTTTTITITTTKAATTTKARATTAKGGSSRGQGRPVGNNRPWNQNGNAFPQGRQ